MNSFIYLRGLKHADHTVFCVGENGQKTYFDPQFGKMNAYSSGQQVKHSTLQTLADNLGVQIAGVTFNNFINKNGKLENKEVWSPCDPSHPDQLIGGWMCAKADGDDPTKKRRSPLSISAMRPLHPLLSNLDRESITFDRSDNSDNNKVIVRMEGRDEPLTEEEVEEYLIKNNRTIPRRIWIPSDKVGARATGLFVYDVAIDLRTLFCVSTNPYDPEVSKGTIEKLKSEGWTVGKNVFGECLIMPKAEREKIIPALAKALVNWRITSNQSRTFSLMETLAVAISTDASTITDAIRAKLIDDGEKPKAKPIIDESVGADLFVTLPCSAYVVTESESRTALDDAANRLIELMMAFDYEHQV